MARKMTDFGRSIEETMETYNLYFQNLYEIAITMFEWKNLPETVDPRFMEVMLFANGQVIFFEDEVLGFLALPVVANGPFNVYNIPINRRAYASNGYSKDLDTENSVLVYNNYSRTSAFRKINTFSTRLYNLDRAIDVNANAQKTPLLVLCEESQRLTMLNLYKQYQGNVPVIMGTKALHPESFTVLKTDAPYVADKLYNLRTMIWNDALAYLGVPNVPNEKRERLISAEVQQSMGGTIANRFGRLQARKDACKLINSMFRLNVDCVYRESLISDILKETPQEGEGG